MIFSGSISNLVIIVKLFAFPIMDKKIFRDFLSGTKLISNEIFSDSFQPKAERKSQI
jgi:hypothetical protein